LICKWRLEFCKYFVTSVGSFWFWFCTSCARYLFHIYIHVNGI
jgi:hypothetical protein